MHARLAREALHTVVTEEGHSECHIALRTLTLQDGGWFPLAQRRRLQRCELLRLLLLLLLVVVRRLPQERVA